jgi:hypothetical protein
MFLFNLTFAAFTLFFDSFNACFLALNIGWNKAFHARSTRVAFLRLLQFIAAPMMCINSSVNIWTDNTFVGCDVSQRDTVANNSSEFQRDSVSSLTERQSIDSRRDNFERSSASQIDTVASNSKS